MERRLTFRLVLLAVFIFLAVFSVYFWQKEDREGVLTVAFLNIGQGDSIFIDAPSGNQVLIDGGVGKSVLRELGRVLPFYDRSIDVVVATHPDADHIGGLNDVLDKYKVDIFLEPGIESDTQIYKALKAKVEEQAKAGEMEKLLARSGMVIDLGGGAKLQIIFPDRDTNGMETNTASIVAQLVYGDRKFMLTGDSPKAIEDYLVNIYGKGLKSDVLKLGHHGSRTSSGETYVRTVDPEYAVVSAGLDNKYGHPHEEVLEILGKAGIKILRTDTHGRIIFTSDGTSLKVNEEDINSI